MQEASVIRNQSLVLDMSTLQHYSTEYCWHGLKVYCIVFPYDMLHLLADQAS